MSYNSQQNSNSIYRICQFILLSFLITSSTFSQESKTGVPAIKETYKLLDNDNVIFYYNSRYHLVRPECAEIARKTYFNISAAFFDGTFTDYYEDSTIALTGSYKNLAKEGKFSFYYKNGQLESSGDYIDNKKAGEWKYWYEDGKPWQTLEFTGDEILVKEFWDEKGEKQVTHGNGKWYQYETDEHFVKIEGEVVNGRQNGKWNRRVPSKNFVLNIEQYEYGKFIKGKILTLGGTSEKYNDKRFCALEMTPAFETAETFQLNQCFPKTHNKWEYATYPGGQDAFYSEIQEKFNYSERMVNANVRGVIEVQTTIDEEGEMGNFKHISYLGGGAGDELIRVLRTMKKWAPKKLNGKPTIQPKIIRFRIR